MTRTRAQNTQRTSWRFALTMTLAYACIAVLWILLSDQIIQWLFKDPSSVLLAHVLKSWVFVAATAVLIFILFRRVAPINRAEKRESTPKRAALFPVLLSIALALAITALVTLSIWTSLREEKSKASAQLLAISESKAREIWYWHQERLSDAAWMSQAGYLRDLWLQWQERPSPAARRQLQQLIVSYTKTASAFARLELVDAKGRSIFDSLLPDRPPYRPSEAPSIDATLNAAVQDALHFKQPQRLGPWLDAQGEMRMAFISPVATDTATPAAMVLHVDPPKYLHPALLEWPLPQETAETFLFTELGGDVLFLSDLRYEHDAALRKSLPLDGPQIAARALRGDVQAGQLIEGVDYRNVPCFAVVQRIGNTEWWLMAKQDRTELLHNALERSSWMVMAGVLALFAVGGALYLYDERQRRLRSQNDLDELRRIEKSLSESEALYRLLADNSSDVVWLMDIEHNAFLYISPSVEKLLGYAPEELTQLPLTSIIPPENLALAAERFHRRVAAFALDKESARIQTYEATYVHKDGHRLIAEVVSTLVEDDEGKVTRMQSVSRDITQRKHDQAELMRLSQAVEQSPASVVITDLDANIEYVNLTFERISGYTSAEVVGKNPRMLRSGQTPPEVFASMWFTLNSGQPWHGEVINRHKSGRDYVQNMTLAPLRDVDGQITHYLAVQLDVTAQKDAEERAHQLAWFHPLSGLPNRNRMLLDIKDAFTDNTRNGTRYALLLLNLDRFQNINDALGHAAGDELLLQVSMRLSDLMSTDHRLAHLSADEFAILMHADDGDAETFGTRSLRLAQSLHEAFDTPFRREGGETLSISCCIGIALITQGTVDAPGEVLRRADTALHRAKDVGARQTSMFDVSMEQLISRRFQIETDLRRGLAQNELRLYLQPQVNTQGQMVGAEALLRWQHPEHGLMPPGSFIPIAEESDLITEVGDWVLQAVCKELGALRQEGLRLPLAVNVSPRQFHQADFVQSVQNILHTHNASAEDLVIEITESIVMDQMETVVQKMSHLTSLGVRFALDDFGTGYSSLAYLKRLPIHELKIDRSFVQDAPDDPNDAALVEAILSVAMHLRLKVVAEGVETREQADFLSARGPVIQQGYLHGRPEPAAGLLQRWRAQQARR
jgi:diguanylate cyclase (GGDEF)-like protein/PAS domain S-box-containing protein